MCCCSFAVTLMCLNVVWKVEGGLCYRSDIERGMMQCPYVILKTFRAPWTILFIFTKSPHPRILFAPGLWNVEVVFATIAAPVAIFTHFWFLCITCRHTFAYHLECGQTRMCHIFITPDFDKVMSNSHLSVLVYGRLWEEIEFAVTGLVRALGAG